jgi:hypothetical protein
LTVPFLLTVEQLVVEAKRVGLDLASSPGMSPELSTGTIAAPPPGTLGCNIVGAPAADESAARSLSADTGGFAAGRAIACAGPPLDFRLDL